MSQNQESKTPLNTPKAQVAHDPDEHIVENILPAREVHIFAGPSGSGKTTLLLKIAENISQGCAIFGHKATPTPFVYISGDRSLAGMKRTMKRLHIDWDNFPLYITNREATVDDALKNAKNMYPDAKLFVVEGFAGWCPEGKVIDYKTVSNWLRNLQRLCDDKNITIWGVVHCAKVKKDERYINPRERILGSAAWGAFAETIFYIEPEDPENVNDNPIRRLMILPRNAKEETFKFDFKNGFLVEVNPLDKRIKKSNFQMFMAWFDALDMDTVFTTAEARTATHLKESSLHAELSNAAAIKVLQSAGRGTWKKIADRPEADPDAKRKWQEAKDEGIVQ